MLYMPMSASASFTQATSHRALRAGGERIEGGACTLLLPLADVPRREIIALLGARGRALVRRELQPLAIGVVDFAAAVRAACNLRLLAREVVRVPRGGPVSRGLMWPAGGIHNVHT